ncbi:MAG: hypothetical protein K2J00_00510 [Bacteroidaceae bacterium]|nr:hypothetical protein [Bacteroidaceae bacterium]
MEHRYITGGGRGLCKEGWHANHYTQLNVFDYMADMPNNTVVTDLVEVQFKNTRKGYYHNSNGLELHKGDIVAVEGNPGHDIGTVTMTGSLVALQVKKANLKSEEEIKTVYRLAKEGDLEKYEQAKAREHQTMIESRQIAKDLGLEMKIGDVEYQGDGNKAIFYYIADGRVDFRQLIKVLAETFHIRVEMKQIGARQEAGRIGGFGPCGRELCCSTWMKSFTSVGTAAARFQNLSLNPQKLAGQCAKLRCCINYEVDQYMEAGRKLPGRDIVLNTQEGEWFFFKADILAGLVSYSSDKHIAANITTITAERAMEVIAQNRKGEKPVTLSKEAAGEKAHHIDLATQEELNRFDSQLAGKKRKKKNNKRNGERKNYGKVQGGDSPTGNSTDM